MKEIQIPEVKFENLQNDCVYAFHGGKFYQLQKIGEGTEQPVQARTEIPYPSGDLFEENGATHIDRVTAEEQVIPALDRIEYPEEGGIYVWGVGGLYPTKGWPTPHAVSANNFVKRIITNQVKFFAKHPILFLGTLVLPWKRKVKMLENWLHEQDQLAYTVIGGFFFKRRYYCTFTKALWDFLSVFFKTLGVNPEVADRISKVFATLIEYDNSYRYRLQDIFSTTSHARMLEDPRREIRGLLTTLSKRETRAHLMEKFQSYGKLLSLTLFIPKVRKAFDTALNSIKFSDLQMDDADRYHTMRLGGYDFNGEKVEDRLPKWIAMHNGNLPIFHTVGRQDQVTENPSLGQENPAGMPLIQKPE